MDKQYIKLIPNHPGLEDAIRQIMDDKKKTGDKTPLFVAPINPQSPEGKTWRIGANVNGTWFDQAAFGDTMEDGSATGGVNVVLNPQTKNFSSGGGNNKPNFAQRKNYAQQGSYARGRRQAY
jgi:hypothetical protein